MGPVAAAACAEFVAPGLDYRFVPVPGISHWIVDEAPGLVADEIVARIGVERVRWARAGATGLGMAPPKRRSRWA